MWVRYKNHANISSKRTSWLWFYSFIIKKKWSIFVKTLHRNHVILWTKRSQQRCRYFSQTQLSHNSLCINTLQNLLFCVPKAAVLHGKSVGFALQKSHFRNVKVQLSFFNGIIFTKLNEKTHTASLGLT